MLRQLREPAYAWENIIKRTLAILLSLIGWALYSGFGEEWVKESAGLSWILRALGCCGCSPVHLSTNTDGVVFLALLEWEHALLRIALPSLA